MKKVVLLALILFFVVEIVFSQINYIHYTPADGLVQTQVTALMQDSKGYIWIGTKAGLSRFDGHTFKNYTAKDGIEGNVVRKIIETDSGKIWILTRDGLHEKKGDHFYCHKTKHNYGLSRAIYNNGTFYLYGIKPHSRVYSFKNGKYTFLKDSLGLLEILGKPYFSKYKKTAYSIIYTLYNTDLTVFKKTVIANDKDLRYKNLIFIKNIFLDKIIENYNGKIKEIGKIYYNKKSIYITGALFVNDGSKKIIFTNLYGKVHVFVPKDVNAEYLEYYEQENHEYNISNTSTIIQDSEGNIWLGGEQGLYRIIPFINYGKNSGIPPYVWSIVEDKNNKIWFGSFQSSEFPLKYYDYLKNDFFFPNKNIIKSFNNIYPLRNNTIYMGSKKLSTGEILFNGSSRSPLMFDGNGFTYLKYSLKETQGFMIYEDTISDIVYGSDIYKLYRLENNKIKKIDIYKVNEYGIVLDIERGSDNKIYLVSLKGISVYDASKNSLQFIPNSSLPMDGNISICKDYKGNLWIGSINGLFLYNYKIFKQIRHPELNNLLTSLEVLKNNTLIVGSIRGIALLDLKLFYEENDTTLRFYSKSSGFYGGEVAQNCITQDSRGNVWVATSSNVVRFNPAKLTKSKQTPKLYIEKVSAFDDKFNYIELNDSETAVTNNYENITIKYTGIYHKAPEQVFYKSQLVGLEKVISPMSKNQKVTYTNLSPGKYTFKLWACNESGIWTKNPIIYNFEIIPAFWQTNFFIVLVSIFFVLLVISISTYFVRQKHKRNLIIKEREIALVKSKLKGQEQEKQRISRELHDGLGGELTGIKMQIEQKAIKIPELLTISQSIGKLNKELRGLSHDLARPLFSSENFSNTVKSYINRVKQSNLEINFEVYNLDAEKLDPSLLYAFYRIIQESLGNVLKHSQATEVFIQITQNENEINLIIEDNGIGFDKNKLTEGIGLRNIKSRVHALNGEINIETEPEKGMLLSITTPLLST